MHQPYVLTPEQYLDREAAELGLCLGCSRWTSGTDPGVARAPCSACGNHTLHGVEQALLLGAVHIQR